VLTTLRTHSGGAPVVKLPPKTFKPEILRQTSDDQERAQLLARQLGIPASDDAEKLWAAIGRTLWEFVPEPKRRGAPPKKFWDGTHDMLIDWLVAIEVANHPKRKATEVISHLKKREPFKSQGDLRRRFYRLKKKMLVQGMPLELLKGKGNPKIVMASDMEGRLCVPAEEIARDVPDALKIVAEKRSRELSKK
jgi:hypothetical protein